MYGQELEVPHQEEIMSVLKKKISVLPVEELHIIVLESVLIIMVLVVLPIAFMNVKDIQNLLMEL
tara:strand:+ start:332 stop:526 length:195 start_codon:yes stop_codon:yes gene_type:complete